MKKTNNHPHPESGQVIILLTVGIITLLAFFALAVEGGMYYSDRRDAQGTADAAALSAARAICTGEDFNQAAMYAANINGYDNDQVTNTVTVHKPPIHGSATGDESAVEVLITAVTDARFVRLVTDKDLQNTVYAVAQCGNSGGSSYTSSISANSGLILLSSNERGALFSTGQAYITVNGGNMFVNSSHSEAIVANGQGDIDAGYIGVVGGYDINGQGADINPTPTTGVAPVTDSIFPNLVPPPKPNGPCTRLSHGGQSHITINPGLYCRLQLSGQGSITMNPGVYWFESGSLILSGQGDIIANNVLLYFGPSAGSLDITGQGSFVITPLTEGAYAGLSLYQHPDNSSQMKIAGQGTNTGGESIGGTFYLPSAHVLSTGQASSISAQIIASSLQANGQGTVNIYFGTSQYYHEESTSVTISLTE